MNNPLKLVYLLEISGVRVAADGRDIRLHAPKGVLTEEVQQAVADQKPGLLDVLNGPRITAEREWHRTVDEVSRRFDVIHTPHVDLDNQHADSWMDDRELLRDVETALKSGDRDRARRAIAGWRVAWLKFLSQPDANVGNARSF